MLAWQRAGAASAPPVLPSWTSAGGYALVFADEFDAATLDADNWVTDDDACVSPRNVSVADGALQLVTTDSASDAASSCRVTGSAVHSRDRFARAGSATEARVYLPATDSVTASVAGDSATGDATPVMSVVGWHTFGTSRDVETGTVSYYWDGVLRGTAAVTAASPDILTFVNTASTVPATMQVDWVRVWQQTDPVETS